MTFLGEKWQKEIKVAGCALCFRLGVYLISAVILCLLGNYETISFSDFLGAWTRWDSQHYIDIAQYGYSGAVENGQHLFLVFYPLFPWILRGMHFLIGDYRLCGVLLNLVTFSVGSVFFYKLAEREYGVEAGKYALLFLSLFPFSFFYGAVLTESVFLMLSAMFFYYLREHRWAEVAMIGFFACLTKNQGCLLAVAVLAELFSAEKGFSLLKKRQLGDFARKILLPGLVCSLMLLGFVIYLGINRYVEGDPFRFLYYQKNHWHNSLCPVWQTLAYLFDYSLGGWGDLSSRFGLWIPDLALFFLWVFWIFYGVRKRLPSPYLLYLTALFLLTYSSTWLLSGGRYTLCALPGFLLTGKWLAEHRNRRTPVTVLSAMLFTVYMTGYLMGRQIM